MLAAQPRKKIRTHAEAVLQFWREARPRERGCQAVSVAAIRSFLPPAERGWRMTMSMSRPSVVRNRNSHSSEYFRKSPRSSRETSGWEMPSSRSASARVIPRCLTVASMRVTS